jgi:hypothetical protein
MNERTYAVYQPEPRQQANSHPVNGNFSIERSGFLWNFDRVALVRMEVVERNIRTRCGLNM